MLPDKQLDIVVFVDIHIWKPNINRQVDEILSTWKVGEVGGSH